VAAGKAVPGGKRPRTGDRGPRSCSTGLRSPVASRSGSQFALRIDVSRALAGLEPGDREIVILRYFLEMNSREIGEMLQVPEGTVRSRLLRCRQQLAERLSQWRPDGECE
jgi:DNA-directed RNA polymerase specialized sigma24 family protein